MTPEQRKMLKLIAQDAGRPIGNTNRTAAALERDGYIDLVESRPNYTNVWCLSGKGFLAINDPGGEAVAIWDLAKLEEPDAAVE